MNEKELELIEKLSDALGASSKNTVEEFTKNILVESLAWMVFGIILLWVAFQVITIPAPEVHHIIQWDGSDYDELTTKTLTTWLWVIRSIVGLIGSLMVAGNVADVIYPRACGISRLLTEIRG